MPDYNPKEIQLVDPLYEPIIMYPWSDLPLCKNCRESYLENYPGMFQFKIQGTNINGRNDITCHEHYQKKIREYIRGKIIGNPKFQAIISGYEVFNLNSDDWLEPWVKEHFTLDKSILREIRRESYKSNIISNLQNSSESKIKSQILKFKNDFYAIASHLSYNSQISECIFCSAYLDPVTYTPFHYNFDIAQKELYDVFIELINTFEMKRLMNIQMTGFLSYKYFSSTHSRFSHVVGTWMNGMVALQHVNVKTKEGSKSLIKFLIDEDLHREFMAALILHDIGHAPFSHVLEMNPHIKYDHEKVTVQLICGGSNYIELEDLLVSSYIDLEYGSLIQYGLNGNNKDIFSTVVPDIRQKSRFKLVNDVIESMGLDQGVIEEFISKKETKDPAVKALKSLIEGVIDIDRIDHIYRDLHYNSFKTMGLPLTSFYHGLTIHYEDPENTYIEINEEISAIVETFLAAREQSNKAIFDNPVNNFYIAVLNSAISDAFHMMPLLEYYIPYITDAALLHVLTNKGLFHNLSPTEKVSKITGAMFSHSDYCYITYKIRPLNPETFKQRIEGNFDYKLPVLRFISCLVEYTDIFWYAFLKDVRKSYGLMTSSNSEDGTNLYFGTKDKGQKFEVKFKRYIEGITWDEDQRSWTFSLYHKICDENREVSSIEDKLKEGIFWNYAKNKIVAVSDHEANDHEGCFKFVLRDQQNFEHDENNVQPNETETFIITRLKQGEVR